MRRFKNGVVYDSGDEAGLFGVLRVLPRGLWREASVGAWCTSDDEYVPLLRIGTTIDPDLRKGERIPTTGCVFPVLRVGPRYIWIPCGMQDKRSDQIHACPSISPYADTDRLLREMLFCVALLLPSSPTYLQIELSYIKVFGAAPPRGFSVWRFLRKSVVLAVFHQAVLDAEMTLKEALEGAGFDGQAWGKRFKDLAQDEELAKRHPEITLEMLKWAGNILMPESMDVQDEEIQAVRGVGGLLDSPGGRERRKFPLEELRRLPSVEDDEEDDVPGIYVESVRERE